MGAQSWWRPAVGQLHLRLDADGPRDVPAIGRWPTGRRAKRSCPRPPRRARRSAAAAGERVADEPVERLALTATSEKPRPVCARTGAHSRSARVSIWSAPLRSGGSRVRRSSTLIADLPHRHLQAGDSSSILCAEPGRAPGQGSTRESYGRDAAVEAPTSSREGDTHEEPAISTEGQQQRRGGGRGAARAERPRAATRRARPSS